MQLALVLWRKVQLFLSWQLRFHFRSEFALCESPPRLQREEHDLRYFDSLLDLHHCLDLRSCEHTLRLDLLHALHLNEILLTPFSDWKPSFQGLR